MTLELIETITVIAIGFALGGILKGATGVGAPIIAVPLLAIYFDVRFAIVIFSIPNILPNIWQAWAYRKTLLPLRFVVPFTLAGMVGAACGTWVLANAPTDLLPLGVAGAVLLYIGFRLLRPHWVLPYPKAVKLAPPVGFIAGMLQTASGLSAPASVTFLSAMKLDRAAFIPTVSAFFIGLGVVQIPMLIGYGFLTPERALLSAAALIPLTAAMPLGARLVRHLPKEVFDRVILGLLAILAIKLLVTAF
ncbi:sulfite exporter TauE/SafE family protein [Pararhodobacter zhoushanensis]|uniref:sulfite exporter TauE/SafE family protein n=1 Tax=Pararhodobacter zhoushanensis TaxID=2479545 RepID=UPI000F8E9C01|nr:sulfite exporter TauE/SafE family protein [Pararhodobacter zhoushanensis]